MKVFVGHDWAGRVSHLRRLDLHHHYVSPAVAERLSSLADDVDVSGALTAEDYDGEIYMQTMASE